jgi:hypothetical protein
MTSIMAPVGLLDLRAPVPKPREYDLLAAARIVEPDSRRWLGGGWTAGYPPGPAHTHDPCSTGTNRQKQGAGDIPSQMEGTFTVYLPAFCTAASVGPNPTYFTDQLELAFRAYEGAAVERVLATGDGHGTLGPYLGDVNMEVLGGGVVTPLRALEVLEDRIARCGTGMIHATPAVATAWAADSLLTATGPVKKTVANGTTVAIGPGYIGVTPVGEAGPAADQAWAFASGPIEIYRDTDIEIVPGNYSEAINRTVNDVLFMAERPYLFNWIARQDPADDDHVQAGVLIDLVP